MAEGAMPGAPIVSGTDEASHFYHQPPPISGLNIGGQASDSQSQDTTTGLPDYPRSAEDISTAAHVASHPEPPRRAHFSEHPVQLEHTFTRATSVPSDTSHGEKDREPASHRGFWQSCRTLLEEWKKDWGAADSSGDVRNLIGDTGIDLHTIRKMRSHNKVASLIGPSLTLARPGLSHHNSSTTSISTPNLSSSLSSGNSTPSSNKKRHTGVDPHEVSHALRKLRDRVTHGSDPKQAKYVQAKADLAHRRNLVLLMVYAFLAYGAPSHRMEEYTLQLMKALDMEGRVNYTVGCTEISFINPIDPNDPMTRSAYTTLVKAQGLDIGACEVAYRIYKDVVHGDVSVDEATFSLIKLIESPPYYSPWFIVPFYGLASAFACVWAYNGWWTDMAVSFVLGCLVGFLQVIVTARNSLYSNVLEVTAALLTSFGARAFASIGGSNQPHFCFGAIAESSITTILPGYIVLCGALELQSKSITAGSTRLFYAVMYSLLLGYGIDVGSQLWAVIDPQAPTDPTCPRSLDPRWKILLVPTYLVFQAILIRSRPKQIPIQVLFGSAAYTVNYFVSQYATAQMADTASALVLGVLGYLYARSRRAFAFASVVAGIMVLVPSGLSAQGGLVSGISTPLFNNGSMNAQEVYQQNIYQSFSVGAQMIQVAVGLSVGLFISALVVYPLGRKNNALFSF